MKYLRIPRGAKRLTQSAINGQNAGGCVAFRNHREEKTVP